MSVQRAPTDSTTEQALAARLASLESALVASNAELTKTRRERDFLRAAYDALKRELELLKRRIFIATAERVDNEQLELEFKEKLELLNRMAETLEEPKPEEQVAQESSSPANGGKPDGRRNRKTPAAASSTRLTRQRYPSSASRSPTLCSSSSWPRARPSRSALNRARTSITSAEVSAAS